jgi:hypothetical protein
MNNKKNQADNKGKENKPHKGESGERKQKGAEAISKKGKDPHAKDESNGAARNTTKKQSNSI